MPMLPREPIVENRRQRAMGLDAYPSSLGDVLSATAEEAWATNPTPSAWQLVRQGARQPGPAGIGAEFGEEGIGPDIASAPMLTAEEANERYGIKGSDDKTSLTFKEAVAEETAQEFHDAKRRELARKDIIARGRGGIGQTVAQFGVGLGVSILDPLNVASAFIPVVGPTRYAIALEKASGAAGRAAVRARIGALEGAVGAAVVEPLVLGAATQRQADYDATDSLLNIAFGTVLGGGFHSGLGALGDAMARRGMTEPVLRDSVAAVVEDRPVEVAHRLMSSLRVEEVRRPLAPALSRQISEAGDEIAAALARRADPAIRSLGAEVSRLASIGDTASRSELLAMLAEVDASGKGFDVPGLAKLRAALALDPVEAARARAQEAADALAASDDPDAKAIGAEVSRMISRGADMGEIGARLGDVQALETQRPHLGEGTSRAIGDMIDMERDADLIRVRDQLGALRSPAVPAPDLRRIGAAAERLDLKPRQPTPELAADLRRVADTSILKPDEAAAVSGVDAIASRAANDNPEAQISAAELDIAELDRLLGREPEIEFKSAAAAAVPIRERIRDFVAKALEPVGRHLRRRQEFINLGTLPDAVLGDVHGILRAHGNEADVTGAAFRLTEDEARKIIKGHGNAVAEAKQGQLAIVPADLERLPEILAAPDRVVDPVRTGANRDRSDIVQFEKQVDDRYSVVLVARVGQRSRRGRSRLDVLTMFKRPGKGDVGGPAGAPMHGPEGSPELNVRNEPAQAAKENIGPLADEVEPPTRLNAADAALLDEADTLLEMAETRAKAAEAAADCLIVRPR